MNVPRLPVAPVDLHDEEHCITAVRADRFTRGQARALFAAESGDDFTAVRVYKTAFRWDQDYADEMEADGIEEPYDGWPWWECGPGQDGIGYWKLEQP